jgi:hypothetical protein
MKWTNVSLEEGIKRQITLTIGAYLLSMYPFSYRQHIFDSFHDKGCKGKGKVVPVLFLTQHHAMKAYWGSGDITLRIL